MRVGVNVPRDGTLSPYEHIKPSLASMARFVLWPHYDAWEWLTQLRDVVGVEPLAVYVNESRLPGESHEDALVRYAQQYGRLVRYWQVGNESDHQGPSSWTQSKQAVMALLRTARGILPGTIVGPGLVSGDPSWLRDVDLSLMDVVAVHPYGQGAPDYPSPWGFGGHVGELLDRYRAVIGNRRLWITEIGGSTDEISERVQADYLTAFYRYVQSRGDVEACVWFCLHPYQGFGLLRDDGTTKPAWEAFRSAAHWYDREVDVPTPTGEFIVGEGVLNLMRQHGDEPGSDELYHPIGAPTGKSQYSETFSKTGARYVYLFSTNKSYRFLPG